MRDSRLTKITDALDEAREYIVDIVDEGSAVGTATVKDWNCLDAARLFINNAVEYVQQATTPEGNDVP